MKTENELNVEAIPYPEFEHSFLVTQQDVSFGEAIDPIKRMAVFSPDEFEIFIQLWVKEFIKKKYRQVEKCGGAGDKGRDVIAYSFDETWDNYQCKHYGRALSPSHIWIEIGKLCFYTYKGSFSIPKNYYFVCPSGVTPTLLEYLEKPNKLKGDFLKKWDTHCKNKITKSSSIELTKELLDYINQMDFSIFKHISTLELITSVKETIGYASIFGGGLKRRREVPSPPPLEIADKELTYTKKIFEAYSDYLKRSVKNEQDIIQQNVLKSHFDRQRKYFYIAESLLVLERDIRTQNDDTVSSVKEEVFDSVIDTVDSDFPNGFERLKTVTEKARKCDLSAHPLLNVTNENDKHGICHHLANEDRIEWVKKDE